MKICMFVKNTFEYDARVTREARALIAEGHEVTVVAYYAPGVTPRHEMRPDGIEVHRVSRVNLGVDKLNALASKYAGSVEARHGRLTGESVDVDGAIRKGRLQPESTVAPPPPSEPRSVAPAPPAGPSPGPIARLWGRISTPVLRGLGTSARFAFRAVKAVLGRQGLAMKTWAINRRMVAVGVGLGADVYHCHDLNTLWVGRVCKRRTGALLVYDSHELQTERNRMGFWWKQWATFNEKRGLPHTDALIVASPLWVDHLQNKYGRLPAHTATVLNVPESQSITPRDLREPLGLDPDTKLLLYQGSIQENRGIEPAIDAIALLPDHVHLVIVGYGYYRDTLQNLVKQRRLDTRIHFFGPVANHELLNWTATADIGLCNIINSSLSYYTTLPNKLFEYTAAGVPVIGSNSPAIGNLITQTGIGETIDPQNPHHIAAATQKILQNPTPYQTACQQTAQTYNWTNEAQHLTGLYEKLSGERR